MGVSPVIYPDSLAPLEERVAPNHLSLLPDGRAHYFVRLGGEPAARVFEANGNRYFRSMRFLVPGGEVAARAQADAAAATEAINYSRTLETQQISLAAQLQAQFSAAIVYRGQTAVNGIAVLVRPDQVADIAALPGVVSVAPIRPKKPMANTSVEFMGTRNFWDPTRLNGHGEGIGVVVIDTGIDFVHTAFGGPGLNATGTPLTGYTSGATTIDGSTPARTFPTAKVIWGWDLVGDAYNGGAATPPVATPSPDPNPMDVFGHGTSCASLVAAFGTINTAANGAFAGSTYPGPWNATEPLIVGTGNNIRTSPGIAPGASLYALRVFGNAGSTFVSADAVDIATAVRIWQLSPAGTPLPPKLAGLTGAAPVPRTPVLAIASMSLGDDAGLDYPGDPDTDSANNANAAGLNVIAAAGNAYDNYYNAGTPADATAALSVAACYNGSGGTTTADSMASYSSRGPRPSDSKLKPDITGPAESVSTANRNSGTGNASFNGTSSATPHVAGAMALLRQFRPGYTAEEYKALIMNSVRVDPRVSPTGLFYGISRIGNGRVTLNPADNFPTALAMSTDADAPVSVSYGLVSVPVSGTFSQEKTVRVVNKENFPRTFSVTFTDWTTTPGATYSLPDGGTVSVPAGGQATLRVRLSVNGGQLRHSRDPQAAANQGASVARNFVSEAAGRLQFIEVGGSGHSMRLSVHGVVRPTSDLASTPANLPAFARAITQFVNLGGTGINTGSNTSTLTNNPADIASHAKGFELQYASNVPPSGTVFEQSEIRYVGVTSDFAQRANPFDPTVANNQSAVVVFAVAMRQDYALPGELGTQVRVLIDRNRTGATDLVVRNYTSNTSTNQNVYLVGTSATAGNVADGVTVTSTGYYANITTGVANNMLNNNLAMLPVNLRQLGITAGTARFSYKVQVTRHDALGYTVNSESPWLTYDVSHPGVDASSPTGAEPFVLSGQPGATLPVVVNQANYQNNASLGLLMVYPHNAAGNRTQVVTVGAASAARLAISGFSPASGPAGTPVMITGSGFNGATGVAFRDQPAAFTVQNGNTITATVPAGATTGAIRVTTPAGSATSASLFVVTPP